MKLFIRTLLTLTLMIPFNFAMAHGSHGSIDEQSAIQIASKTVKQMTFKDLGYKAGKLEMSWKSVETSDIKVSDNLGGNYTLRVTNPETNQALDMIVAASGKVLEVSEYLTK